MLADDIQRELLRDTAEPEGVLNIGVNIEIGYQNPHWKSSNNASANAQIQQRIRNLFHREANGLCRKSGQTWTTNHRQVYKAKGKKCNRCF